VYEIVFPGHAMVAAGGESYHNREGDYEQARN
jgi:hypothetical protein